ncbi:hypothetical protein AAVH_00509 [Aphelenchoides avenae]|nr:hypothetical protein AAVH_38658 [Aphelenchus avenae]KAH7731611.1 hypothetical protein AAVH_00509 [Aphelenchus avenae]
MFDPIAECERTREHSKSDAATHQSASRTSSMVAENGASNGHLPCEGGGCADCVETVPTRSNEQIVVG